MKNLSLIAAVGQDFELGKDNNLIWKIPEDLMFYKKMTIGKNIIMGRNTLESMPPKALENRTPIILSTKNLEDYISLDVFHNIESLLSYIRNNQSIEFMVVGGAKVYEELLPYVDTMYLTEIKREEYADSFFPYFYEEDWNIEEIGDFLDNEIPYVRNKYTRKKVK